MLKERQRDFAVHSQRSRPWWRLFWAIVALANLGIGILLAFDPERAGDFQTVRSWTTRWLFDGADLYTPPDSGTDYPPHAIVVLAPLALLPSKISVPAWAALNLLLAVLAPVLAARVARRDASAVDVSCLVVLFLAWSGTRTLLQFTLLVMVLGLSSMAAAERRPAWGGVCLGLAMMKPQIGVPFFLWALLARRWRVVAVCCLTVAIGSLLWCAWAWAPPFRIATRYLEILGVYYWAEGAFVGVTKLEPLFAASLSTGSARTFHVIASLLLLAVVCVEGWWTHREGPARLYPAPAMAAAWSLLTFYHLTYSMVLLLPAAAALWLDQEEKTARQRRIVFWLLQFALVLDAAGVSRRLNGVVPGVELLAHYHRLVLLALFVAMWLIQRATPRNGNHISRL